MGKTTHDPLHPGPDVRSHGGRGAVFWAATSPAAAQTDGAHGHWPTCPKGRGIFPNLSVRENLVIAARRRHRQQDRLDASIA
jgi:ABC-type branched-subunit amino acid transport system ATPase component